VGRGIRYRGSECDRGGRIGGFLWLIGARRTVGHGGEGAAPVVARRDAAVRVGAGVDEAAVQGIIRIADRPRAPNQQADQRAMFNTSDCPLLYLEGGSCVPMQAECPRCGGGRTRRGPAGCGRGGGCGRGRGDTVLQRDRPEEQTSRRTDGRCSILPTVPFSTLKGGAVYRCRQRMRGLIRGDDLLGGQM